MKKYIVFLSIILCQYAFPQDTPLKKSTTSNLQNIILKIPLVEDIESQLIAITTMKNKTKGKSVEFKETQELGESMIADLTPIIFMGICPDSLNNKKIDIRFYGDRIILWSPTGFYYPWHYVDLSYRKYNLYTKGVKERTEHIKKVINDLLPRKYLITISLFPSQRFYYPYIGYYENDNLVIFNDYGERYNSIDELLTDKFGSIEKYIETYKKDVH